jgi:hypothetical protein
MKMKKLISIMLTIVLSLTLLVGCATPMEQYESYLEKNEVVEQYSQLMDEVKTLEEALDEDRFQELGTYFDELDSFESVDELLNTIDFTEIIDSTDKVVELANDIESTMKDMTIEDEDVLALNEDFLEGVAKYKEMAELIDGVVEDINFVIVELYEMVNRMNIANESFSNVFSEISPEYSNALFSNFEVLERFSEAVSAIDFNEVIASGEIDVDLLEENKQVIIDTMAEISAYETYNEADVVYNDGLIDMMSICVDLFDFFVEFAALPTFEILSNDEALKDEFYEMQEDAEELLADFEATFIAVE